VGEAIIQQEYVGVQRLLRLQPGAVAVEPNPDARHSRSQNNLRLIAGVPYGGGSAAPDDEFAVR